MHGSAMFSNQRRPFVLRISEWISTRTPGTLGVKKWQTLREPLVSGASHFNHRPKVENLSPASWCGVSSDKRKKKKKKKKHPAVYRALQRNAWRNYVIVIGYRDPALDLSGTFVKRHIYLYNKDL